MSKQAEEACTPRLLKFNEGDPEDPVNWSGIKKKAVVVNLCFLSLVS